MAETWKPVPGWKGLYEVSNLGRVRSLPRTVVRRNGAAIPVRGKILTPSIAKRGGYLYVLLHRRGKRVHKMVHTMVAAAFIGRRPKGLDVRHHNGNCLINRASNLRYGTRKQNMDDSVRLGRTAKGSSHGMAKLSLELAASIRAARSAGSTCREIAETFGISIATASRVGRGHYWQ